MFQLYQCTPAVDILPLVLDYTINVKAYEKTDGHGALTGSAVKTHFVRLKNKAI